MIPFLRDNPRPDEPTIREALSGNLCRCTGYENIVQSVRLAAERMAGGEAADAVASVGAGLVPPNTTG
jgi:carbon-monoxide dehydrogenase small subunit